jgi:hypothetical protein
MTARRARRTAALTAVGTAALMALAGCGGSGEAGTGSPGGAGGGKGGTPTLTIESPANGASVGSPVTLKFSSSEAIGAEETGRDHVHLVIDGKTDDYAVVTSTTHQIKGLTPGRHTIGVTLQHADHSPAGANAEVTVNVTGGGQPASPPTENDGGGGYGY